MPLSTYFRATVNDDVTNITLSCGDLYGFTRNQEVMMYHVCHPDKTYTGHITQVNRHTCSVAMEEREREQCAVMLARVAQVWDVTVNGTIIDST